MDIWHWTLILAVVVALCLGFLIGVFFGLGLADRMDYYDHQLDERTSEEDFEES